MLSSVPWKETWVEVDPKKVTEESDLNTSGEEGDANSWFEGVDPTWNPMAEDFRSVQNLIGVDPETPLSFQLGVKGLKETLPAGEIPCRFYEGSGPFCWKGKHCPHLHVPGKTWKDIVNSPLDLGKEVVYTVMGLDAKKELVVESTFEVCMMHVISPTEFYVMPRDERGCDCMGARRVAERMTKCRKKALENCDEEIRNSIEFIQNKVKELLPPEEAPPPSAANACMGHECYVRTMKTLNDVMDDNMSWRQRQSADYAVGELVAIRVEGNEKKSTWTRGEVLEADIKEVGEREVPWYQVRLIDVGSVRSVPANEMTKLPQEVAFTPCLVYKCSLINTDPIRGVWDTGAKEMFQDLVRSEVVQIGIKRGIESGEIFQTVEFTPYQVELKVLTEKGDFVSVNRTMKECGAVLTPSRIPYRPRLKGFLNDDFCDFFLPNEAQPLNVKTIETERKRLIHIRMMSDRDTVKEKCKEAEAKDKPGDGSEAAKEEGARAKDKVSEMKGSVSDAEKAKEAAAKDKTGDAHEVVKEEAEAKDRAGDKSEAVKKKGAEAKKKIGNASDAGAAKDKVSEMKGSVSDAEKAKEVAAKDKTKDTHKAAEGEAEAKDRASDENETATAKGAEAKEKTGNASDAGAEKDNVSEMKDSATDAGEEKEAEDKTRDAREAAKENAAEAKDKPGVHSQVPPKTLKFWGDYLKSIGKLQTEVRETLSQEPKNTKSLKEKLINITTIIDKINGVTSTSTDD